MENKHFLVGVISSIALPLSNTVINKLFLAYSTLIQKEYPLRLRLKASVIGSMGIVLLILQNTFLHQIDAIQHASLAVGKMAAGVTTSLMLTVLSLGSSQATMNGVFVPGTWTGSQLTGNICQETYFCKYTCSGSTGASCYTFCNAGTPLGSPCVGANSTIGSCVGFCASTLKSTLKSCTQQPSTSCTTGDSCIGFSNPLATKTGGAFCTNACGSSAGKVWTTGSLPLGSVCATGFSLVSGSLVTTSTGRSRHCGSPFAFDRMASQKVSCSAIWSSSGGGGRATSTIQPSYMSRFVTRFRDAIARFDQSCAYQDVDYQKIIFEDIQRNPNEKAIKTLQAYCIVKGYTVSHNKKYHAEAATTIGEAIKVLTKIIALDEGIAFDEFARHRETLPYADMQPNARYVSYVLYADGHGYLDGITAYKLLGRPDLKALTPISKKQLKQLLTNYGVDVSAYTALNTSGRFISRATFAQIVVDAFQDKLRDYAYMYGNNITFYRRTLNRLENLSATEQQALLNTTLQTIRARDPEVMGRQYNLDVEGMIALFEEMMR